jgi:hypothetical protein
MKEPEHHRRYREAWAAYRTNLDPEEARRLEREMDSAQERFTPPEFHAFKRTLPGFVEYWNDLPGLMLDRLTDSRPDT